MGRIWIYNKYISIIVIVNTNIINFICINCLKKKHVENMFRVLKNIQFKQGKMRKV